MKKLLIAFLLLLPVAIFAQDANLPLAYSGTVKVEVASQKELALRAREWFINSFKNPKAVLQVIDIENGEIVGNGVIPVKASMKYRNNKAYSPITYINVKIKIQTKDNGYQYSMSSFKWGEYAIYRNTDLNPYNELKGKMKQNAVEYWQEIVLQCIQQADELENNLKASMNKKYKDF